MCNCCIDRAKIIMEIFELNNTFGGTVKRSFNHRVIVCPSWQVGHWVLVGRSLVVFVMFS